MLFAQSLYAVFAVSRQGSPMIPSCHGKSPSKSIALSFILLQNLIMDAQNLMVYALIDSETFAVLFRSFLNASPYGCTADRPIMVHAVFREASGCAFAPLRMIPKASGSVALPCRAQPSP